MWDTAIFVPRVVQKLFRLKGRLIVPVNIDGLIKFGISTLAAVMFGWFRKKTRDEDTEAFKLGRRIAQEATSSFEQFMERRFGTLHDEYLNILRGSFQKDIQRTDAPPMPSARISYKIYLGYSMDGACTNWAEEFFSRMRRAEQGHHHHIAGPYLLRYAQEASWGGKTIAGLAMANRST
jgi:hypothetical protein